jgi:hypothetical protein
MGHMSRGKHIHHTVRGIEGRRIFEDGRDREGFLNRLGKVIEGGQPRCFVWALLTNPRGELGGGSSGISPGGVFVRHKEEFLKPSRLTYIT